jgi:hypothetical protein
MSGSLPHYVSVRPVLEVWGPGGVSMCRTTSEVSARLIKVMQSTGWPKGAGIL